MKKAIYDTKIYFLTSLNFCANPVLMIPVLLADTSKGCRVVPEIFYAFPDSQFSPI
jgi:hypothetical protein